MSSLHQRITETCEICLQYISSVSNDNTLDQTVHLRFCFSFLPTYFVRKQKAPTKSNEDKAMVINNPIRMAAFLFSSLVLVLYDEDIDISTSVGQKVIIIKTTFLLRKTDQKI